MKTNFEKSISFGEAHVFPRKYKNLQNIPHWHKEHELVFAERGTVTVMIDGIFFTLYQGMCAFLHSEDIHNLGGEADSVTVVVKLDADFFHRIVGSKRLLFPILERDYGVEEILRALFSELKEQKEYGGLVADSMATELMARIFRTETMRESDTSAYKKSAEKYKSLLDLISKEYPYITFEDAAKYMHFSKPYFSKYFYQHSGMTFTRYLNMIKISFAAEMVLEGTMTMTEISQACGFNTIRNFNRVFKEMTGYAPNSLPKHYNFIRNLKEYADIGFDPTLNCTEILDP